MDKRYQVFVSSTYTDLKDERKAIIQTLIELDCIPAGMELFPAADEDQFKFIQRIIDDCDYYLLIIGGRYGSLAPDGVSYTEKEYDYARAKGLKILAFIHEHPGSIQFDKSEADPILRPKLDAFRKKAMTSTVAKAWSDPKDLRALVAVSLPKTIKIYPATGWVRANQIANADALAELNELRKSNHALEESLRQMTPVVENIAGLDDALKLTGYSVPRGYTADSRYGWALNLTWGELFAAVGPYIVACPNDLLMHSEFDDVVQHLWRKQATGSKVQKWHIDPEHYQKFKLQMKALGLVDMSMQSTTDGGSALFWSLTHQGESALLARGTAKKS